MYRNSIDAYQGALRFPYVHRFYIDPSAAFTWNAKLNNQFKVNGNLEIQLTAIYLGPTNIPQGRQYARSSVDLGLSWKILKGKGVVNFSASDILNTYGIHQNIDGEDFVADYENQYETQVFRLGLKYRF